MVRHGAPPGGAARSEKVVDAGGNGDGVCVWGGRGVRKRRWSFSNEDCTFGRGLLPSSAPFFTPCRQPEDFPAGVIERKGRGDLRSEKEEMES